MIIMNNSLERSDVNASLKDFFDLGDQLSLKTNVVKIVHN